MNKDAVNGVVGAGAEMGQSPVDVAGKCDIMITMFPYFPHVKSVVLDKNGILEGCRPGQILVDMSSISPIVSKDLSGGLTGNCRDVRGFPVFS